MKEEGGEKRCLHITSIVLVVTQERREQVIKESTKILSTRSLCTLCTQWNMNVQNVVACGITTYPEIFSTKRGQKMEPIGEILRAFDDEDENPLSEVLWRLVHETHDAKAFLKLFNCLVEKGAAGKGMLFDLDHLLDDYRYELLVTALAVGFVLGKNFGLTDPQAAKEYERVEKALKSSLPYWSSEREGNGTKTVRHRRVSHRR